MDEQDWFSKNSYNVALKYSSAWQPRNVLRITNSCIQFINLYPTSTTQQIADDLSLRLIFCHFLSTILLTSLARAEDNIETQLQDYVNIRKNVDSFDKVLQEKLPRLEEGPANDLINKLSILLAYDFEAACRLKAWDDLSEIVLKANFCKSMKVYELMADCILSCEAPTNSKNTFRSSAVQN
jgi:hypothetical protein